MFDQFLAQNLIKNRNIYRARSLKYFLFEVYLNSSEIRYGHVFVPHLDSKKRLNEKGKMKPLKNPLKTNEKLTGFVDAMTS